MLFMVLLIVDAHTSPGCLAHSFWFLLWWRLDVAYFGSGSLRCFLVKVLQLNIGVLVVRKLVYFHGVFQNRRRRPNLHSCLSFITCQHPDIDASVFEILNAIVDVVLELVFKTSDSEELILFLYILLSYPWHQMAVVQLPLGKHQSPQASCRVHVHLVNDIGFRKALVIQQILDLVISTLAVVDHLVIRQPDERHAHHLPVARELIEVNDLILLFEVSDSDTYFVSSSTKEFRIIVFLNHSHQNQFILVVACDVEQ